MQFKSEEHKRIEQRFLNFVNELKDSRPWQRQGTVKVGSNSKLITAASRITVPSQFEPYLKIIERRSGRKFQGDYQLNIQQVRDADHLILEKYKKSNFDFSRLNRDALMQASIAATREMGLLNKDLNLRFDLENLPKYFPQTSSACFPTYQKKSNPEAQAEAVKFARDFLNSRDPEQQYNMLYTQITTMFHRYQFKLDNQDYIKVKIRPIWGVPFGISIVESFFFRDLIDGVRDNNLSHGRFYTPLGLNLKEISSKVISHFRGYKSNDLLSMDLKNFDSTVPSFMFALFYANMWEYLPHVGYDNHFINLMKYHCYTPFCYQSSEVQFQRRGTPSGCLITAYFNSWVNRVIYNYAHLERGTSLPKSDLCVLGDDNLYVIRRLSPTYIYNVYTRFGMEVNSEKTDIVKAFEDIPFLGYWWDSRNRAYQKESWFMTHLCLPSSFYTDVGMPIGLFMTYRAISVCLPLANGHSMFMRLIGFEDKYYRILYDKYLKGEDTVIEYVTNDTRFKGKVNFPFSLFIKGTWEDRIAGSIGGAPL